MAVDVLAIGAHPDDVEVGIGALVHKLARGGVSVSILDLTRGEMASRGTVDERAHDADASARILGAASRSNAGLPDGAVANTDTMRRTVLEHIRRARPRLLLAPYHNDRHPDHEAAHFLVRDAAYLAGLNKLETDEPLHRPERILYYRVYGDPTPPQFIVDVSKDFDAKLEALRCYASQFHNPGYEGVATYVASPEFWEMITARARYWGGRVGVQFGEPLYADGPVRIDWPPGTEVNG